MHVSFLVSRKAEMYFKKNFVSCTWSSSNLYISQRICYQGTILSEKTGMLLHSSSSQMQGCVLLCYVPLLPVSAELLQLLLINKQEQLPLR